MSPPAAPHSNPNSVSDRSLITVDLNELDAIARPISTARGPGDPAYGLAPGIQSGGRLARNWHERVSPGETGADLLERWWAILGSNQ
jgi:hypothetical protein